MKFQKLDARQDGSIVTTLGMLLLCNILYAFFYGKGAKHIDIGVIPIPLHSPSWSERIQWFFTTGRVIELIVAIALITAGAILLSRAGAKRQG